MSDKQSIKFYRIDYFFKVCFSNSKAGLKKIIKLVKVGVPPLKRGLKRMMVIHIYINDSLLATC